MQEQDLKLIFNAIESGKCLAFLGAGACTAFRKNAHDEVPGLPTGGQLAEWLAEKCQYTNGTTYDLARVADYFLYTQSGDREPLIKALQEKLNIGCSPRPIHTVLAQLSHIKTIITSNYDDLLETELRRYGRALNRNVYNLNNSRAAQFPYIVDFAEKDIILHKMHGSIDEPSSIIVAQSDYIRYLAHLNDPDRGMPEYFRKGLIPQRTLLFLGYSLEDWNFRVIWEGVLANYQMLNTRKVAYALVKNPSDYQKAFWMTRNVRVFDFDLTDFAVKLAEHFDLEIPQLDIRKKTEAAPAASITKKRDPNKPITILFLTASPRDTKQLELDQEWRAIDEAIRKAKFRDKFKLEQHRATRVRDLQGCLQRYEPDIVHFSGHGFVNEILLEDESGNSQPVSADALRELFGIFKNSVRCVVLNACFTQMQARAVAEHIDCVIGTYLAFGDEAARHFAAGFYERLAYGHDVQSAFDLGKNRIRLEGLSEYDTPKLTALRQKASEIVFVQNQ